MCRSAIVDEQCDHVQFSKPDAEGQEKVDTVLKMAFFGDPHELERIFSFSGGNGTESYMRTVCDPVHVREFLEVGFPCGDPCP